MNRRQLFAAAPALAFLPSVVAAAPELSPYDQIINHARELYRLLAETCPDTHRGEFLAIIRDDGYFTVAGTKGRDFLEVAGGWVEKGVRA